MRINISYHFVRNVQIPFTDMTYVQHRASRLISITTSSITVLETAPEILNQFLQEMCCFCDVPFKVVVSGDVVDDGNF